MAQVLRNKSLATKFQMLAEIAANQPNIQQRDIAKKLDVTPQAVSEHIRELVKEGLLASDGRSKYKVTTEGVNWVIRALTELESYSTFVEKAVTNITVCAAVADCNLSRGQAVRLSVRDGLLFASEAIGEGARGTAVSDAREGEDVGVSNIDGTVEMKIGEITILKVPGIQRGGSKSADLDRLKKEINGRRMIGAIGIEALIALRRIGAEPHCFYGVKEAAIEAAHCGLSPLVVCVDDEVPGLLQGLGEENFNYETLDLGKSNHTDM